MAAGPAKPAKLTIRRATAADFDCMVEILKETYHQDPNYPYRYPDRDLYPADFDARCQSKCSRYLEDGAMVCELPCGTESRANRVAAFGVWLYQASPKLRGGPALSAGLPGFPTVSNGVATTRDANPEREKAFHDTVDAQRQKLFDTKYLQGHMFLKLLLCHPHYQRQGAGRALTIWGIDEAKRRGIPATVLASPMGFKLYRALSFTQVGRFRVRVPGEEESLDIRALVFETRPIVRCIEEVWSSGGGPSSLIEQVA